MRGEYQKIKEREALANKKLKELEERDQALNLRASAIVEKERITRKYIETVDALDKKEVKEEKRRQ